MHSVVFICSANMCRSPMAQAIFAAEASRRGLNISVTSAGIWDMDGETAVDEARSVCERQETPMPKCLATHIGKIDFSNVTRVFVMEHRHVAAILEKTTVTPDRISLMGQFDPQHRGPEIADPIGKDAKAFERCYMLLRDCIKHYLDVTDDFKAS